MAGLFDACKSSMWPPQSLELMSSKSEPMQVQKEGTDVTLVGYGKMVGYNLDAAAELQKDGISCEVILPLGRRATITSVL